jgi:hypothetical protein
VISNGEVLVDAPSGFDAHHLGITHWGHRGFLRLELQQNSDSQHTEGYEQGEILFPLCYTFVSTLA